MTCSQCFHLVQDRKHSKGICLMTPGMTTACQKRDSSTCERFLSIAEGNAIFVPPPVRRGSDAQWNGVANEAD